MKRTMRNHGISFFVARARQHIRCTSDAMPSVVASTGPNTEATIDDGLLVSCHPEHATASVKKTLSHRWCPTNHAKSYVQFCNDVQEMLPGFPKKGLEKGNDQNDWPEHVFKNGWCF